MRVCSYCHLLLADSESVCSHDGAQARPVEVPPIPSQLHDKFTSLEPYARGQTGTCHVATQQPSGYRGLLKLLPLAGVEASERVRLKRELRKQTRLVHDALPRIIDGGEIGAQLWLFREYIQGESLAQRIRRLGTLEPAEALVITAQVASALDELQRNGLLHRDVKPGHIILHQGPDGLRMAKLIDAGVAARLPTGSVFGLLGTPAYISPEQVAGKLVSFRSDLYGLGCVLFEMLSGQPPFPDEDVQAVLEAHKSMPAPELQLDLPSPVRTLLHGLLAKEPRQRPFSAQQVRRTLEPLLPAGTSLPAIGTRAPAGSLRPAQGFGSARAGGDPQSRSSLPTEELDEIELEEIPLGSGPNTLQLSNDEVDALEVNSLAPGPKTLQLSNDEVDALEASADSLSPSRGPMATATASEVGLLPKHEPVGGPTVAGPKAPASPAPRERMSPVQEAVARDPDGGAAADSGPQPLATASAGEISPASKPATAGRRSVDFDVESLFDDGVPAEPSSLHDVAPTQIFRPRDGESSPAARMAAPGSIPPPVPAAEGAPEGTVTKARPAGKPRRLLPWALGAAALAVAAFALARGRREPAARNAELTPAVVDGPRPTAPAGPAKAPSASAAPAPATEELGKGPAPSAAAAAGQPLANSAPAQVPATEPAVQPAAPSAAGPAAAGTHPAPPSAAGPVAAGTQPVPAPQGQVANHASGSPAIDAQQAPGKQPASTTVLPATLAAGANNLNASATADNRSAELTAANAAGRAQTGTGDARLAVAPGARADRVNKGDEYKTQGRDYYQAGRFREAAAAYQRATEQNPSDAGAFAGLAASRLAAGDAAAAVQAYSRAVRLQPDSSGFHAALGRAYLQKGDRDRARSAYQHALELNPNNGAAKTALEQLK